ncbi:MAG TPA: cysteine desulfurase NifS [Candidatus Omnitrophota bacterium]|nr:cysteine desulfurase NifS [Candidatus Omnitrophota bacterium]HPT07492.1 cysteine desulfurase NifS [Candidatus Omnitrophota bacterium]
MKKIYLDYAATTPTDPEVLEAMKPYFFEKPGNASSIHTFGQEAKKGIEDAREKLASLLSAKPEEIVFTSGGTESNNTALKGIACALREKGNHIITTAIEHHAISEPCKFLEKYGFTVTTVGVDRDGLVDPADIKKAITDKTILVSVMHANNEIGVIQPIAEIGTIARARGIVFHTDAVQTVGHIPVHVDDLQVDLLSLSAHKFYGPKGVGALYVRKGTRLEWLLHGGDQERNRRGSTYNTPGIVGLGKAVELCAAKMDDEARQQILLRDAIIEGIMAKIPEVRLNGHRSKRLPNNANLSVTYIEGESMLLNLDMKGIAVSTGSACTSSSLEPSHVLLAIGLAHEIAHGSLRFSLGRWSSQADVDYLLEILPPIVANLRAMSPLYEQK